MKGTCCKCKSNPAVMQYKGGVFCKECKPELQKTTQPIPIGIGLRYYSRKKGNRELKGKKSDLCRRSTHKMRSNMGMNYEFQK